MSAPPPQAATETRTRPIGVRAARDAIHLLGATLLAVATFVPWVRSGERGLDLYELRLAAERLEAWEHPWMLVPLPLVPLALAAAAGAWWWGRRLLAHGLSTSAALYVAYGALLVDRAALPAGPGVRLGTFAAASVVLSTAMELGSRWRVGGHRGHLDGSGSTCRTTTARARTRAR